jgi:hypothetical protein
LPFWLFIGPLVLERILHIILRSLGWYMNELSARRSAKCLNRLTSAYGFFPIMAWRPYRFDGFKRIPINGSFLLGRHAKARRRVGRMALSFF